MPLSALLAIALLAAPSLRDYVRSFDSKSLDQTALDAEGYGEKKAFHREDGGLRITLEPGSAETGWKTPQALRIGGDFTISAEFDLRTLPKPAQEDGVAVGLAVATQNADQPDVTLVRLIEPSGDDVYRSIVKENGAGAQPGQPATPNIQPVRRPGGKPPKPPRHTFPAKGGSFRLKMRREGGMVRFQVLDALSEKPRYLGQARIGMNDLSAVKLFASNRNGAEAVNVLLSGLSVQAERLTGLGTTVRTVFGQVVYGEPTEIKDGVLIVGGPAKAGSSGASPPPQPGASPVAEAEKPAQASKPAPESKSAKPTKKPEPKAKVPLDEVDQIHFERPSALSARVLGQPNIDLTGPHPSAREDGKIKKEDQEDKEDEEDQADDLLAPPPGTAAKEKVPRAEPEKNGIRDLHVLLSNLRDAEIKQVTVNGQTDKGPAAWRLDTTDSKDWPLVMRRAGGEPWADLFLEPPSGDWHQKELTINITYKDNQAAETKVKPETHSDPKAAFDPDAGVPSLRDVRVFVSGDGPVFGKLERLDEESVRLKTPWQETLEIPLSRVGGLYMGLPEHKEPRASFSKRLESRGTEDLLLARSKNGEVVAIPGVVERTEAEKLHFVYQAQSRTLPLDLVEGLVLADRPAPDHPDGPRPLFSLTGDLKISGKWVEIGPRTWKLETPWGQTVNLPAEAVEDVRFRGGQVTYLSDLEPSLVEETPFFGHRLPWKRDANLRGGPLKIDGRTYGRGLAVHSRSVLTYDLDARYSTFRALVGFDDSIRDLGRVECRVFADDKELFANSDLRADAPPVSLDLPVSGARQLRLVVDFGPGQDTGDRVIWADARLYRRPPPGDGAGGSETADSGQARSSR